MTVKSYNTTPSKLYGFGSGSDYNLFQNNRTYWGYPYRVGSQAFTKTAGTTTRMWAIDTNGYLYYWGYHPDGTTTVLVPTLVDNTRTWTTIAHPGGSNQLLTTVFGISGGKLYHIEFLSGGLNITQIGSSTTWTDLDGRVNYMYGISGGVVYAWPTSASPTPVSVGFTTAVSVKREGTSKYFVLLANNDLYLNDASNAGSNLVTSSVKSICDHSVDATGFGFITTSDALKVYGANASGELGLGNTTSYTYNNAQQTRTNVRSANFNANKSYLVTTTNTVFAAGNRQRWPDGSNFNTNYSSWTSLSLGIADTPSKFLSSTSSRISQLLCTNGNYYQWNDTGLDIAVWSVGKTGVYYSDRPNLDFNNQLNTNILGTAINSNLWKSVADSSRAVWAINNSGELYAWGNNEQGHCLTGNYNWVSTPTKYGSDTDWHLVNFPYALKTDGKLYKFNTTTLALSQLGSALYQDIPVREGNYEPGYAVKFDGTLWYSDTSSLSNQVGSDTDWDTIVSNGWTAFAKKTNGAIYKQTGAIATFTLFSSANYTSLTISSTGGTTTNTGIWAVKSDGTLWQWGYTSGSPIQVGSASDWTRVQNVGGAIVAINTFGEVWSKGTAYINGGVTNTSVLTQVSNTPFAKEILTYGRGDIDATYQTSNSYIGYLSPASSFTLATTSGTTVELTNNSTNATNYLVDWGDGTTSTVASNRVTGAPSITPKLSHTYTVTSDSKFTVTLTAYSGNAESNASTQTTTFFVTQSPTFTVVQQGTGPTATFRNTSPNTLGATSIFGSGNKWRWDWGDGTFDDVNSGSGNAGDRLVNLTHLFAFTGPEIVAAVPVNRTVILKAYNGHASSPFSSASIVVSVVPVNPKFPNVQFTTIEDADIPAIFNAPKNIIWGTSS